MAHSSKPSLWDYILRYRKPPPQTFLAHYGVKGQKWGIRRGPPYPLSNKQKKRPEKIVAKSKTSAKIGKEVLEEAIRTGEVSLKLNLGHQKKHLPDREDKGRSYILGDLADAQRLVLELSGTGELVPDGNGNWTKQERVTASKKIGVYVSRETGKEILTEKLLIIYAKKGTHIYAARVNE